MDTYHSVEFDGGARDRERFQEKMLQRFLTPVMKNWNGIEVGSLRQSGALG